MKSTPFQRCLQFLIALALLSRIFTADAMTINMLASNMLSSNIATSLETHHNQHTEAARNTELDHFSSAQGDCEDECCHKTSCFSCCVSAFINTKPLINIAAMPAFHTQTAIAIFANADLIKVSKPPIF